MLECEADGEPRRPDMVRWIRNGEEVRSYLAYLRLPLFTKNAGYFATRAVRKCTEREHFSEEHLAWYFLDVC